MSVYRGLAANTPYTITILPTNSPETNKGLPGAMNTAKSDNTVVPGRIKITASNTVMYATIKNNRTAHEFVELLPLKLKVFDRIAW